MRALRIMSWNVRLFSAAAAFAQGISHTAESDAKSIVDMITGLATDDPPDVITFNEVWDDGAGEILRDDLKFLYPHSITSFGSAGPTGISIPPVKLDNSGLMIVSRFPFVQRPNGDNFEFRSYDDAAGDDALSDKGVALVQIAEGGETTTIAFTHMQASYDDDNSAHADVRAKQLGTITTLLKEVLGDPIANLSDWRRVIVTGDINIRGDRWSRTEEWKKHFGNSSAKPGDLGIGSTAGQAALVDGWNTYMGVPDKLNPYEPSTPDPGYTNLNFTQSPSDPTSLYRSRLDYHAYSREPGALLRFLVPHHMMTRLKGPSDHWSVESCAQYYSYFCHPSDAINLFSPDKRATDRISVFPGNAIDLRRVELRFEHSETYQWIFFDQDGTFSFFIPEDLEVAAYAAENLTHSLSPETNPLDLASAPDHVKSAVREFGFGGRPTTYALPRMGFLRVRAVDRDHTGRHNIGILRHRGDSPQTAIVLRHDVETDPRLPTTSLNPTGDDVCWFKVTLPELLTKARYVARFSLFNRNTASNNAARWALFAQDTTTLIEKEAGDEFELAIQHSTTGRTDLYLTLRRADPSQTLFTAKWLAPLSALYLREPLYLFCEDETGADWFGDDEITLKLYLDGEANPFYELDWDSADTDEFAHLLEPVKNAIRLRLDSAGLTHTAIPFATGIRVEVAEDDGVLGSSTANAFLTPAPESDIKPVILRMNVQSGKYALHAMIGKWRFS